MQATFAIWERKTLVSSHDAGNGITRPRRVNDARRAIQGFNGYNEKIMLMIIYQALGAAVVATLGLVGPLVPALRRGLRERFGGQPAGWWPPAAGRGAPAETIWVPAASVGEVRAAAPLVAELLRQRPAARVLVSTFTATGRQIAAQTLADGEPRVRCLLLPLDWGWIPGRVISRERPALFVLLETELWPVLLTALRRARVPVLIANGRISPRSFGRYRALRTALRPVLDAVTLALVRTPGDAQRYQAIGLPADRVRVAGNLKHARRDGGDPAGERRQAAIRGRLHAGAGRPVLVAGSVRGSESALVLEAFGRLHSIEPALLLVLAPRHPDNFDPGKMNAWPGAWVRWSEAPPEIGRGTAVVVLDTLGELADFYAAADVACVGGTWGDHGGHNLLEPAYHGVPVVFGPGISHGEDEGLALLAAGGGFVAGDAAAIFERIRTLLADRGARDAAGSRAREVAKTFSGAAETVARAANEILDGRGRTP
jgi:3-deoxy-D-manno-octulosonic-acid transferase